MLHTWKGSTHLIELGWNHLRSVLAIVIYIDIKDAESGLWIMMLLLWDTFQGKWKEPLCFYGQDGWPSHTLLPLESRKSIYHSHHIAIPPFMWRITLIFHRCYQGLLHHHQIECVLHVRTLTKEWLMRSKEGKKEERLAVKMEKLAVKMENWKCREKM